eukprot:2253541-Rhodomonas_salina.4
MPDDTPQPSALRTCSRRSKRRLCTSHNAQTTTPQSERKDWAGNPDREAQAVKPWLEQALRRGEERRDGGWGALHEVMHHVLMRDQPSPLDLCIRGSSAALQDDRATKQTARQQPDQARPYCATTEHNQTPGQPESLTA